jgi:glycerol 3-phosphatase-2
MIGLATSTGALATDFDLAIVDLDGTTYMGTDPIPHAASGLNAAMEAGLGVKYVTNNAARPPTEVAAQLVSLGFVAKPEDVLTASQAGAEMVAERFPAGAKVLVVGGEGLELAIREAGLTPVRSANDDPAAVLQGFHPSVDWHQLSEAVYAVRAGVPFFATNLDLTLPTERGFSLGNGSLVAAVVSATGVQPQSPGKPEPTMLHMAARSCQSERPLVVGDRLNTDLAGARAADIPGLIVLTGVSTARDVVLAIPQQRPSFIGADLRCLLDRHEAPTRDGDWWRLRASAARVVDGMLELVDSTLEPTAASANTTSIAADAAPDKLDPVRVAAAAVWAAADAGEAIDPTSVPDFR